MTVAPAAANVHVPSTGCDHIAGRNRAVPSAVVVNAATSLPLPSVTVTTAP